MSIKELNETWEHLNQVSNDIWTQWVAAGHPADGWQELYDSNEIANEAFQQMLYAKE